VSPVSPDFPAVEGVEHRYIDAGGLRVHLAEAGRPDAPPVLLLHGWPQAWWMWRGVIAGLRGEFRLLVPELRGFGATEAPGGGYDGETFARDQVALLDALGIDRIDVIGHDWGGWTAFLLGLLHPARVERLLVCNAPHPWIPPAPRFVVEVWRSWYALALALPGLGPALLRRTAFAKGILRRGNVGTPFTEAEIAAYADAFRPPERAGAIGALYRHYWRAFAEGARGRWRAHRLEAPTLLLFGERDLYISAAFLPGFEQFAENMRLERVPDSGHFIVDEKPELVVERALSLFG
jgi:pimeloyl-ACP methyl ester carboxylesterase